MWLAGEEEQMTQPFMKAEEKNPTAKGRPVLTRRSVLFGGAVISVGGISGGWWLHRQAPDHDRPRLSPAEAFQRVQKGELHLIDIRTPREWRVTGIPAGAIPLDMRRQDFLQVLDQVLGENRAAAVALICARGVRSARMTVALEAAGYTNVIDVPEGMLGSGVGPGWVAGNLPVSRWDG